MAFHRIKEAAEKIGVMPHVLRFWESQFPTLKPAKTSRGQRLYSDEDVDNFQKIKHLLYNEGYSIPGAKKFLKEQRLGAKESVSESLSGAVEREVLREVFEELKSLREDIQAL
jgi:DNA-binding transcriptional MerR regulator